MKRFFFIVAVLFLVFLTSGQTVIADGETTAEAFDEAAADKDYSQEIRDVIPDELDSLIGDSISAENIGGLDAGFFLDYALTALPPALSSAAKTFALLFGMIVISALACAGRHGKNGRVIADIFEWVTSAAVAVTAFGSLYNLYVSVSDTLSTLGVFVGGIIPVAASVLSAAGRVTSSAVTGAGLSVIVSVLNAVTTNVLLPLFRVCFGLELASSLTEKGKLSAVNAATRRAFIFICGLVMSILTAVFAFQTSVASRADGIALRTARFSASSFIPVVGGAVSEAASTVLGSLSLVKSLTGAAGVAVVLLLAITPLISAGITRLSFSLSSAAAEIAGCEQTARLLSGLSKLCDLLIAVLAMTGVMVIFDFTVFMNCAIGTA